MKIVASGIFGAFVWELPASLAEAMKQQAELATRIGAELFQGEDVPDITRFLTDELTQQVTTYLLLLYAVKLTSGPGGLVVRSFFDREMKEITERCSDLFDKVKDFEQED